MSNPDYRDLLFTATRKDTDVGRLDLLTFADNLIAEIDRLDAVIELLGSAKTDEFDARAFSGVSLLLGDIRLRIRTMLDLTLKSAEKE